jgi:excisionase family DNA binding protein
MAKKMTFEELPGAVGEILDILQSGGTGNQVSPETAKRLVIIEKKIDNLEKRLFPDRKTMNRQAVCRVLKLRPKQLIELENSGVLVSHMEGNKAVYYEDDVMRCYAKNNWRAVLEAAANPELAKSDESESAESMSPSKESVSTEDWQFIDIDAAAEMVGKKKTTIYKLTSQNKMPFIKRGSKLLFDIEALREWLTGNSSRKRKSQDNEIEKADSIDDRQGRVDIYGASEILGRTPGAIRQHLSSLPHEKVGNKLYFDPKELEAWAKTHTPRKRKSKHNETTTTERPVEGSPEG